MGRLKIIGPQGLDLVQMAFTNDIERLEPGRSRYGLICNPEGGVIDDAIVYRLDDGFLMVPNATNKETVLPWLLQLAEEKGFDTTVEDQTPSTGMMAVQGPLVVEILSGLAGASLDPTPRFGFCQTEIAGVSCMASRTGYTGEDGFELICPVEETIALWEAIHQAGSPRGLLPAGLGARDSLRIEACLPLHGHELTEQTDPLAAGLGLFVKMGKADFVGKSALERRSEHDRPRRLAAFEMTERAVPRQGCLVEIDGRVVGEVTSGLFSPTLGKGIGLAYIQAPHARPGTPIALRIHKKIFAGRVVKRPIYKRQATPEG
jgi:aminomethyltransferase